MQKKEGIEGTGLKKGIILAEKGNFFADKGFFWLKEFQQIKSFVSVP